MMRPLLVALVACVLLAAGASAQTEAPQVSHAESGRCHSSRRHVAAAGQGHGQVVGEGARCAGVRMSAC